MDLLTQTGRNTGNLLFAEAVTEIAGAASRVPPRSFQAAQAEGHDCILLAAANWLGPGADFGAVSAELEATNLPILVLGLGAQAGLDRQIPRLHPGMKRLVDLLAERSPMISVRGPFSAEVLAHYGVHNVMVTGCPSLLKRRGVEPGAFTEPGLPLDMADVVIHGTRHHYNAADPFQGYLYREALRLRCDVLLQPETADMVFTAERKGTVQPHILEQAMTCLVDVYQASEDEVETYLAEHGRCFFDIASWLDYYRGKRFVIGSRIHGTIAAVLAGTPALLIAHDARTVELAETMGLPFVLKSEIDTQKPLDLEHLYAHTLAHDFSPGYQRYRAGFQAYFEAAGLKSALPV
uniref:polysaccharide pyruvyl transferase family protein n=1 Tax=Ruegeria sp. PR1b TaxID=185588 RepID=UPI00146F07BB|nr:polysaccharide pyruvyl transferase family protein [Ruegeria sp. PR1b]